MAGSRAILLLLPLFLVCSASGLAGLQRRRRQDETVALTTGGDSKTTLTAAAGGDGRPQLRWIDRPATKSALLVVAGGLSGAMAKSATAPLERVKIMSQAGDTGNFVKLLADVVRIEGWAGLWRGNTANVIRVIPNKGVLMMCSDMYKAGVTAVLPACGGATISSVAGGLAGLTAVLCTYPLELARTRMAFRICDDVACAPYSNVLSTLRSVVAADGPLSLYSGVGATLIGALPFEGLKFGAYDIFKSWLPRTSDGKTPAIWTLVAGAGAGAIAHALTYPLDTVRRRMQISGALGAVKYTNAWNCLRTVAATEGWMALFYGLTPTILRALPNLGLQFFLYEVIKTMLGLDRR